MFEIMPDLDSNKNAPLYIQLYEYIKHEIQTGTIKPEEKLPSKRKLSKHLGISQNTIQTAYEQLCAEGYIESKPRKGLFVINIEDELLHCPIPEVTSMSNNADNTESENMIDFSSGKIDLDSFPYSIWKKLTIQSILEDQNSILYLGEPQGDGRLREEIAKYLFQSRGVTCLAEQIIIGAGTQFLLILLCMLIGKEYGYAIENPGFYRARNVFKDQGIDVLPVSMDESGICMEELRKSASKVVYITPSHQFPNGMIMPVSRRLELLKWCEENCGYIIEDDYDSEFRYKGKPIPSLQGLDTSGSVIYLGTFSKSFIPSVRMSYLVLPPSLMQRYQESCAIYKQTVSRLHQDTLYRFMKEGYWSRHINKMRTVYRKKHKTLLTAIANHMGGKVEIIGENAGLHILLKVKNGMSEADLIKTAYEGKVKVYPTSICYVQEEMGTFPSVLLGFGGLKESQIEEGIKLLKTAWNI